MKTPVRTADNKIIIFYTPVFTSKEEAEQFIMESEASDFVKETMAPVKTCKAFGGPMDGWMINTPFGFYEID